MLFQSLVLRLGQNTWRTPVNVRMLSEFYHPFPATESTPTGQYLMQAVWDNELQIVQATLESGADPNFRAKENVTPVMVAAEYNKLPIVVSLIKHGANLNLQDDLGETALMKASRSAHKEVVDALLKHGAQTDILNYEHMTAREATLDVEVDKMLSGNPKDGLEVEFNSHDSHSQAK